jgi:hypothetical protein
MRDFTDIELDGAVTIDSDVMEGAKVVQVLCTNVSGTSDGTMAIHGSLDAVNYQLLSFVGQALGTASPVASLTGADLNQITIVDALVATWVIDTDVYPHTKLVCIGDTGDNTTISGGWSK